MLLYHLKLGWIGRAGCAVTRALEGKGTGAVECGDAWVLLQKRRV